MNNEIGGGEGGSSRVFLVLGLLVGAALGAGGGFYFFSNSSDSGVTTEKGQEQEFKGEIFSIPFERMAVPIYVKRGERRQYIGNYFIDLQVNVYGAEHQITVKRSLSQLQHSFISAITKSDLMREDSPTELDVDRAAEILKAKASEIVGADVVESITISKSMRIAN